MTRNIMPKILCLTLLALAPVLSAQAETEQQVASPDGELVLIFDLQDGAPHYSVALAGQPVLLPSALGYVLRSAGDGSNPAETESLTNDFEIVEILRDTHDETWRPPWGEAASMRSHYNELAVSLRTRSAPERRMDIVFRVFDDGLGFRYRLPEQPELDAVQIQAEATEFRFAGDHLAWWIPANPDSYEHTYRTTRLAEVSAVATPITMKADDGLYLSIHEANLTDYPEMNLVHSGSDALKCDLVPWPDGVKVKSTTPMQSPWRTLQVARRAGALVESHLVLNLNEPSVLADTSWIQPMKYMGIWWSLHLGKETWAGGENHGATTENARRYIDFCAAHGIGGLLIEGWNEGWETWLKGAQFSFLKPYADFDLEEVARYAKEKGVALIGHHETGGNIAGYEKEREQAFAMYQRLGVHAIKTGYAGTLVPSNQHRHGQWMVRHYREVVKRAAAHQIAIDAHEPIKPTGIRRTYPNMMTREGVRGMEYNAWSDGNPPEHTTILPFTRMLAGPLDYTPGIFDLTFNKYKPNHRVYSTLANQLALFVVLFSPLQMAADLPENYERHPAFEFIKAVPTTWDETRVPHAEIGDYVVVVRRQGEEWFLGAVTDEEARELEVPLDFLAAGQTYTAHIYADGDKAHWERNPTAFALKERMVRREETLTVSLAAGGGQAIWFEKEHEIPVSNGR